MGLATVIIKAGQKRPPTLICSATH